jgi:hypothetical protein
VSLALIGALAGPARSAAVLAPAVTSFSIPGILYGVAATSASNAWAVGDTGTGNGHKTLIMHWNGKAWS